MQWHWQTLAFDPAGVEEERKRASQRGHVITFGVHAEVDAPGLREGVISLPLGSTRSVIIRDRLKKYSLLSQSGKLFDKMIFISFNP